MATVSELEQVRQQTSFVAGLKFWATLREPIPFNVWQQGFSQIRTVFMDRDPDAPQPGADYTAVVSAMRDELMEEIHGPFWKRQLSQGPLRPSSKAAIRGAGATARTLAAGFSSVAEADGRGSVLPAPPEADGLGRATDQERAGRAPLKLGPRGPASASGRLERDAREPFEFVIPGGRRGPATEVESQMGVRRGLPPVRSAEE